MCQTWLKKTKTDFSHDAAHMFSGCKTTDKELIPIKLTIVLPSKTTMSFGTLCYMYSLLLVAVVLPSGVGKKAYVNVDWDDMHFHVHVPR